MAAHLSCNAHVNALHWVHLWCGSPWTALDCFQPVLILVWTALSPAKTSPIHSASHTSGQTCSRQGDCPGSSNIKESFVRVPTVSTWHLRGWRWRCALGRMHSSEGLLTARSRAVRNYGGKGTARCTPRPSTHTHSFTYWLEGTRGRQAVSKQVRNSLQGDPQGLLLAGKGIGKRWDSPCSKLLPPCRPRSTSLGAGAAVEWLGLTGYVQWVQPEDDDFPWSNGMLTEVSRNQRNPDPQLTQLLRGAASKLVVTTMVWGASSSSAENEVLSQQVCSKCYNLLGFLFFGGKR